MTRNRKAELQRRLAMRPVATPPAGLADRIKRDIPAGIGAGGATRTPWTFSLRIAASVIIVAASAYLGVRVLSQIDTTEKHAAMADGGAVAAQAQPALAMPDNIPPEPGSAKPQPPAGVPPLPAAPPRSSIAAMPPRERIIEERNREAAGMRANTATFAADTITMTGSAPVMAPPPPPLAAAAPLPAPPPPPAAAPPPAAEAKASESIVVVTTQRIEVGPSADVTFGEIVLAHSVAATTSTKTVYEVTLRADARPDDVVATVKEGDATRTIRVSDVPKP